MPDIAWSSNPDDWANVDDFGVVGDLIADDTDGVQAALNSGKRLVVFPRRSYNVKRTVTVPPSVERIVGFDVQAGVKFVIAEASASPLEVRDVERSSIILRAARPVIMRSSAWNSVVNETDQRLEGVHLVNVSGFDTGPLRKMSLSARHINNEYRRLPMLCDGLDFRIFGFKAEGNRVFQTRNGCRLEVLGGTAGVNTGSPLVDNWGSLVSLVFATSDWAAWKSSPDALAILQRPATDLGPDYAELTPEGTTYVQTAFDFTTGPNSTQADVYLYKVDGLGSAWVDDFTLSVKGGSPVALPDSGFEAADLLGWGWTAGQVQIVAEAPHAGAGELRITARNGGLGATVVGLQPSTTYTLSAWARGEPIYVGVKGYNGVGLLANTLPLRVGPTGNDNVFVPQCVDDTR